VHYAHARACEALGRGVAAVRASMAASDLDTVSTGIAEPFAYVAISDETELAIEC
jgi:hypothetical protein